MTTRLTVLVLFFAAAFTPAGAGEYWRKTRAGDWYATHRAVYELENWIALLEADPETNLGFKAPVITATRGEIARLRASLGPAQWRWIVPCCYSRRPIHIR